jgi:hypothetical protein
MGASASTLNFLQQHKEAIQAAFASFDTNGDQVIDQREMAGLVGGLLDQHEVLHGCGKTDIDDLASLMLKRFSSGGLMTISDFCGLYEHALVSEEQNSEFLMKLWGELGIKRMKAAQAEWLKRDGSSGTDGAGSLNMTQLLAGGDAALTSCVS